MKIAQTTKKTASITKNYEKIMEGISSNTLDRSKNAFLDIHSKIIAVVHQKVLDNKKIILVIEKEFIPQLKKHLEKYLFMSDSSLDDEPYTVYANLDNDYQPEEDEYVIPLKKGQLVLTTKTIEPTVTEDNYTQFRLKNNMPQHGKDYKDDMALNVSEDDFISYTKGCFLGQEIVAKVHGRAKSPKKLIVKYENECSDEEKKNMTSKCTDPSTGKVFGFVFVKNV